MIAHWSFVCHERSPLFLLTSGQVGISQVEQKIKANKKQKDQGRKDKTQIQDNKTLEGEVMAIFLVLCMYVYVTIARTLRKSYTATKNDGSSLVIIFTWKILTLCCPPTAWHPSLLQFLDSTALCRRLGCPALHPGLYFFVSFTRLTNVLVLALSNGHAGLALCVVFMSK